jgi:phosphoribosyl-AMP cyclohydrolase / phosphoribosyl-ATP pyrophosphohydrolase
MNMDFDKGKGLMPAIVQDHRTLQVLMLGYMNEEAYELTKKNGKVTFFSRTKNRLWTKGESSGHHLTVNSIKLDCDGDTLLIQATPAGPTCHTGSTSCFQEETDKGFIYALEETITQRIDEDEEGSYTNTLYKRGIAKVAQKVGEEAVELVIEAMKEDEESFKDEAADLLYHFLILLKAKDLSLTDIESRLKSRHLPHQEP